jgi:hypothetical protein
VLKVQQKGRSCKQLGAEKTKPTEDRTMTQKRVNKGTKEIKAMMVEDVELLRRHLPAFLLTGMSKLRVSGRDEKQD